MLLHVYPAADCEGAGVACVKGLVWLETLGPFFEELRSANPIWKS